jgi:hypothetical protein
LNIGVEFALDDEGKKVAAPRARLMTDWLTEQIVWDLKPN